MRAHGGTMTTIRAARPPVFATLLLSCLVGHGEAATEASLLGLTFDAGDVILVSALLGVTVFAVWSVIATLRGRQQVEAENAELRAQVADLRVAADRAGALIEGEDQRIVVWERPGDGPFGRRQLAAGRRRAGRSRRLSRLRHLAEA